jgi:hypothetical protein
MNTSELDFIREIAENSDGSETRIGDFVIRRDYGIDCVYDGPGGEVLIPEEIGSLDLSDTFKDVKNITGLVFPKTAKIGHNQSLREQSDAAQAGVQRGN